MAAAVANGAVHTNGNIMMWGGTDDGEEGYFDYATGTTNMKALEKLDIAVNDIRARQEAPVLNEHGMTYTTAKSSLSTEQLLEGETAEGSKLIKTTYYDENTRLLQNLTGSKHVYPVSYKLRIQTIDPEKVVKDQKGRGGPRPVAHIDRDPVSALANLEDSLGAEKAQELLKTHKRWAMVNTWRPIGNAVWSFPLAFIDHHDIKDWAYDSHIARLRTLNDNNGSNRGGTVHDCFLKNDERYRYHYVSGLRPDEVLAFYSFHTDPKMVTPHSALVDHNTPEDAPPRQSIELRSWVFFED